MKGPGPRRIRTTRRAIIVYVHDRSKGLVNLTVFENAMSVFGDQPQPQRVARISVGAIVLRRAWVPHDSKCAAGSWHWPERE